MSHGRGQVQPQNSANVYYFSKGGEGVFNSTVQDYEGRVIFRFANVDGEAETRLYDADDEVVAIIDWSIRLQPVLKYEGEEIKVKKWISRVQGNT